MKPAFPSRRLIAAGTTLAALVASTFTCAPAHAGLLLNTTALWPASTDGITRIGLCWRQGGYEREAQVILGTIRRTWGAVARVDVSDAGLCGGTPTGNVVPVTITPSGNASSDAHTNVTGRGGEIFMTLSNPVVPDRLRNLAVHEFGHVLGLQHEQDSPLADPACTTLNAWGNVTQFGGTWDRASVMNSDAACNVLGNALGYLSPGDVDTVRTLYGRRAVRTSGDFTGGGSTDWATWNPSTGWVWDGAAGATRWGEAGDVPVPGDYDGDGKTDLAVWRPSTGAWWIAVPLYNFGATIWGQNGDLPVQADYDGDGKTDLAIFRPSTRQWWFGNGMLPIVFGQSTDIPVPADYDGDGKADVAVFTPSTGRWSVNLPDTAQQIQFGTVGDIPLPGDYLGEGRARPAVYRPSAKCFLFPKPLPTTLGTSACFPTALPGDVPVKGRYTGQLQEEPMLFRPSTGTYITRSGAHNTRGPANSKPVF